MRVRDPVLALLLVACGAPPGGGQAEPLSWGGAATCPPGKLLLDGACAEPEVVVVEAEDDNGHWVLHLALHAADGRSWWFAPQPASRYLAEQACEAVEARLFLPATRRDLGVGVHFAALAHQLRADVDVWLAMEVDARDAVVRDLDGAVLFPWRMAAPPFPGHELSQELRVQQAIDAAEQGEGGDAKERCLSLAPDGALRLAECDSPRFATLCVPGDAPRSGAPRHD